MLWIGFVVHRTLPVAICDPSIGNGPGGPLSLDPNSSLQESSSGGLACSADSAVDRQTDLGYSGTVWNKWSETGDVECLTTAVIYTNFRTASKVLGVGVGCGFRKGGGNRQF
ncbi:hypothetical protein CDAR_191621 [Caerostris darwini]|uniref:Uncharacterized protein n=1 Tax=Caerostris darwini TaxID=1538125 RepID=A0AAV4W481_9ARAC|nr:hypothetical protein CDAR_191621 [Caerostris darwini]